MPWASRYLLEGRTFHLTHRCHDRRFLLRFSAEPHWTDALAVGSAPYVQSAQQDLARQRSTFVLRKLEAREEPRPTS